MVMLTLMILLVTMTLPIDCLGWRPQGRTAELAV